MAAGALRQNRFYRGWMKAARLTYFSVRLFETDLAIAAERDMTADALETVVDLRNALLDYAHAHEGFLSSMRPLAPDETAPDVVRRMCRAAEAWDVGPMAAVAGTFAEIIGERLLASSREVIVENGGDVFIATRQPREVEIFAGDDSPFAGRLAVRVNADSGIHGICTSSGTVGHSFSHGKADAVVAFAESAAFADAAATAIANRIKVPADIQGVVDAEKERAALKALVAVAGDTLGAFGDIEFVTREE